MQNWESRRVMISGLRYGVTVRTLNSGIWTKSIKTSDACSMRARARASWGLTERTEKWGLHLTGRRQCVVVFNSLEAAAMAPSLFLALIPMLNAFLPQARGNSPVS